MTRRHAPWTRLLSSSYATVIVAVCVLGACYGVCEAARFAVIDPTVGVRALPDANELPCSQTTPGTDRHDIFRGSVNNFTLDIIEAEDGQITAHYSVAGSTQTSPITAGVVITTADVGELHFPIDVPEPVALADAAVISFVYTTATTDNYQCVDVRVLEPPAPPESDDVVALGLRPLGFSLVTIAVALALLCLCLFCVCCWRRRRRKKEEKDERRRRKRKRVVTRTSTEIVSVSGDDSSSYYYEYDESTTEGSDASADDDEYSDGDSYSYLHEDIEMRAGRAHRARKRIVRHKGKKVIEESSCSWVANTDQPTSKPTPEVKGGKSKAKSKSKAKAVDDEISARY